MTKRVKKHLSVDTIKELLPICHTKLRKKLQAKVQSILPNMELW